MKPGVRDARYDPAHIAQIKAHRRRLKPRGSSGTRSADVRRSPSQHAGDAAETQALEHLEQAGLVLVARNVSCRVGEIDLIMRHAQVLVFVEVRSRRGGDYGGAAASIGRDKQARIARAAQHFLRTQWRGPQPACRFDVVAFDDGEPLWIRNAFE